MKNSNLYINFIRFFYDIAGDLDEYSLAELQRFGTTCSVIQQVVLLLVTALIAIDFVGAASLLALVTLLTIGFTQNRLVKKLTLDKIEIEAEQVAETKKRLFKRTLWQVLTVIVLTIAILGFIWKIQDPQSVISDAEFVFQFAPLMLGFNTLFFFFFYLHNLGRIVVIDEENIELADETVPNWLLAVYVGLNITEILILIFLFTLTPGDLLPLIMAGLSLPVTIALAYLDKRYKMSKAVLKKLVFTK